MFALSAHIFKVYLASMLVHLDVQNSVGHT